MQKVTQQQIADKIIPFLKAKHGDGVLLQARRYFLSTGTNGKVEVDFTVNGRPHSETIAVKDLLAFDPKKAEAEAEAKRKAVEAEEKRLAAEQARKAAQAEAEAKKRTAEEANKQKATAGVTNREIRTGDTEPTATEAPAKEPEAPKPAETEAKGRGRKDAKEGDAPKG